MAGARGVIPAQLALAWLLCQGDDIVPIPGTRKAGRLEENCGAVAMDLSKAEADALASALPAVAGERYDESSLAMVNG